MKKSQLSFFVLFFLIFGLNGFAQLSTTIPLNEKVVSGVLPNKMHYYIMHNEFPKDRVSFYFAQNVGAILEEDSQNGLAHFLEHMAFNGTEHFNGKGFLNMLQKQGVRFGYDINAFTARDETVYNISNVPVGQEWLTDSCLYVLHDWSCGLSLEDGEIDAERGVIREEWRTGRSSGRRMQEQMLQVLFKGSKYAKRDVIGDTAIINNFAYDDLRAYYKKWYRPDLQAVVIVGDIDPVKMEEKVKAIFSPIPLAEQRAERTYESIPDHDDVSYSLATDPEATRVSMMLLSLSDQPKLKDPAYLRDDLKGDLVFRMLNNRMNEYIQNNESDLLGVGAGQGSLVRLHQIFSLQISPKPGKELSAFKEAYTEFERARRFGFTPSELDRAKQSVLSQYEDFVANQNKITNDQWASNIYEYFLSAEPFVTPENELAIQKMLLSTITVDDVNAEIKDLKTDKNQMVAIQAPQKDREAMPSLDAIQATMNEVKAADLKPYTEETDNSPLVAAALKPAAVKKTFAVAGLPGAKGYVLGNGARVVVYPTDLAKDEILFSAFSFGGNSLLKNEDLATAQIAVDLVEESGLGAFKASDLSKKLSGKIVSITPAIGGNTEAFNGSTNKKDFGTLNQLLYLYFTEPRFEELAFSKIKAQLETYLKNASVDNRKAMRDTISVLSSNHSPRTVLMDDQFVGKLSLDRAKAIYTERISNAADFTFVFVGNVTDSMMTDIQTYIGNLPSAKKVEKFVDHKMVPAPGKTAVNLLRPMPTAKTSVYLSLSGQLAPEDGLSLKLSYIGQLLEKKYLEIIREEIGGSYGVNVFSTYTTIPSPRYTYQIVFDTDPGKAQQIMGVVYEQIEAMKAGKVDEKGFNEVKASVLNLREQNVKTNRFWMRELNTNLQTGEKIFTDAEYKALVESITPQVITELAKKVFEKPDQVEVLMNPAQ